MSSNPPLKDSTADEARLNEAVLAELAQIRKELRRSGRLQTVDLDDSFDRIGLGSLELNELVARLEDRVDVVLASDVLSTAETPRDLVVALRQARPAEGPNRATPRPPPVSVEQDQAHGPAEGETLMQVLDWHCAQQPDRNHITMLDRHGVESVLTYRGLRSGAAAIANGLLDRGVVPGENVAMVLPSGRAYFETFMGVLLAGAVPIPIYPPTRRSQLAEHLRRQVGILQNAQAVALVTMPEAQPQLHLLQSQVPTLRDLVTVDQLRQPGPCPAVPRGSDDTALVQYTSGSTGAPKGVVLTHANLLANIRAMVDRCDVRPDDVFVSWLPLYHDMGLIGAWLGSLTVGMKLVVMSPVDFLTRPSRWLWAIHEHGGTLSAGPNFAYSLCVSKIEDSEIEGLDLSRWRLAFNGAEPVSADTLALFSQRFGPFGFQHHALTPVYGLAESSVGLTFPPPGRGPVIDRIDREHFVRDGIAEPYPPGDDDSDDDALRVVACGRPLRDHEVRVVDDSLAVLPDRHQGRVLFRGPSATAGYLRNPAATQALFAGTWLDTGDLGYFASGDLYVTGRVKDIIVRAGRNLHPAEIEEAVGALADVRTGCVAVFAPFPRDGEREQLVVLAETRLTGESARAELRDLVIATCVDLVAVAPDEVMLVPPGTVPKTSSGKIRRSTARERYVNDSLLESRPQKILGLARIGVSQLQGWTRRMARLAGDAAWAGYAWCVLALFAPVFLVLVAVLPGQDRRRHVVQRGLRGLARVIGIPLTLRHPERFPAEATVVVANHPSWIDALVLQALLPTRVTFIGREVLADQPVFGFALRRLGALFVERHDRARSVGDTERLMEQAAAGETLMMFPEGHLDTHPGLRSFHLGAFTIAAQAGVVVTPIAIRGTRAILAPTRGWPRRGHVVVSVGHPIRPTGQDWAAVVDLHHTVRSAIAAESDEPDLEQ